ncbi:MAG: His/Gly/Thr/Pro-type tRNA ligase C-terminal domain-containing protein [Alphaproteobacteria bacterium]
MSKKAKTAITPTREENFPEWYQQVVKAADLAENSPVRGCMTVKPYGWAIWENMVGVFDPWLKDYGVQNASFPMLIPVSFLSKEAEHVEGFAKECAVVTHHRLEANPDGNGLRPAPAAELEEPYVVRPTSETIIGDAMARWIQSYRDLPMKLNQWCSVLRWEMRPRIFLRTGEFFWHEGHNAFADHEGAKGDCLHVLGLYDKFFREYLAVDGVMGIKTEAERFPGANETYSIECMMQDGKALQACTTHDLGTNFAKTFGIKYQSRDGGEALCHTTSWAFTTRMIGALIMMHGDDDGMVMPPRIAPQQVVVLPVLKGDNDAAIMAYCAKIAEGLKGQGISAKVDERDMRTPDKMWDAIKKGIPLRVEVGGREMEEGVVTHVRRDIGRESKATQSFDEFIAGAQGVLDAVHDDMLAKQRAFREKNTHEGQTLGDVIAHFDKNKGTGFVRVPVEVLGDSAFLAVTKDLSLTTRCMPFEDGGKTVLIAKAY